MKVNFSLKKISYFILFFSMSFSFAQNGKLSGKVKDDFGNAIFGVNLTIENTSKGASTDFEGNYVIDDVPSGNVVVVARYLGFKTIKKEILINGETTLDFVLEEDATQLQDIIVTGVVNKATKLKSSVSITSINVEQVEQTAPRSTAEIFRTIPGIRSESSGGEGNSNISVRGVPISSGGSKYLQIQEDGLPVLLYGDMSFATADIFTRFDGNIAKVEAIRGGSASTLS